jgi:hypothetical protein
MVQVRNATPEYLPAPVDSNSPAYWVDGQLHLLTSTGMILLSRGSNQFSLEETEDVDLNRQDHLPVWVEAAWMDPDGTLFLWYHHEPGAVCTTSELTAPMIGAAVSYDGGRSIEDLGIILETSDAPSCDAKNGFFAGGHGDFSVMLHDDGYFYFYFGNYGGDAANQGVAAARMAYADRFQPQGAVHKYFRGEWTEEGVGGEVTPVFPVRTAWQQEDADAFWGPSIHWNRHLNSFVMLLNHACCKSRWNQEGIYISYNRDLSNPDGWSQPQRVLDRIGFSPGFYPQVLGIGPGETDKLAGRRARLYVHGVSLWELEFEK